MMEVLVTAGAEGHAQLQSNHNHQQTNNRPFTDTMLFPSPNHQCKCTGGRKYHITKKSFGQIWQKFSQERDKLMLLATAE